MTTQPPWLAALETILAPTQIVSEAQDLVAYAIEGRVPRVIVYPETVEQVAAILQWAQAERRAVLPWGSGTQMALGNIPRRTDIVLCTGRLQCIRECDAANFTITAEAGVTYSQVARITAGHLQTLPLQYTVSRATLGGIIATNAYNPKRLRYGGVRDLLLGIRLVLPSGEIAHFGGKVVKNVAGYDMCKLFLGSLGSLGVIVEATFKVYALPEHNAMLLAAFPSLQQGAEAVARLMGTQLLPSQILLLNEEAARTVGPPATVEISPGGSLFLTTFEGMEEAVARQLTETSQICREDGAQAVHVLSDAAQLQLTQALAALAESSTSHAMHEQPLIVRLGTVPARVHTVMDALARLLTPWASQAFIFGDCGVGLVRLRLNDLGQASDELIQQLVHAVRTMPQLVATEGGYVVVEAAPQAVKEKVDVWGTTPVAFPLLKALKIQFDPAGIMNPGRFIGAL